MFTFLIVKNLNVGKLYLQKKSFTIQEILLVNEKVVVCAMIQYVSCNYLGSRVATGFTSLQAK